MLRVSWLDLAAAVGRALRSFNDGVEARFREGGLDDIPDFDWEKAIEQTMWAKNVNRRRSGDVWDDFKSDMMLNVLENAHKIAEAVKKYSKGRPKERDLKNLYRTYLKRVVVDEMLKRKRQERGFDFADADRQKTLKMIERMHGAIGKESRFRQFYKDLRSSMEQKKQIWATILDLMASGHSLKEITKELGKKPKWIYDEMSKITEHVLEYVKAVGEPGRGIAKYCVALDAVCDRSWPGD